MELGLEGRVVLVTGGGAGIGLATVAAFADEGAIVVAADLDPSPAEALAGEGRRVDAVRVDATDADALRAFVDAAAARHGRIDVLVNNVGLAPYRGGFLTVTDEQWRALLEVNLFAAVRTSRAVIPHMLAAGGGALVHLASDAAMQPDPFFVDYAVSKAAILSLSKSLSKEFGPHGIRSNCVAPGPTATGGMSGFLEHLAVDLDTTVEAAREYFAKDMRHLPLERMNDPADVAGVIVFLASDAARQVTGASYRVDAGSHVFL